jgi:hypothetical protein
MTLGWFVRHKRFGRFKTAFHRSLLPLRPLGSFPKLVHLYWDQGFDQAPELVRMSARSWQEQNPDWTIRLWDGQAADGLVSRWRCPRG